MSKNISKLSGRIGLKDNLFQNFLKDLLILKMEKVLKNLQINIMLVSQQFMELKVFMSF